MNTTVDSKVVEMKFDNKQFESNVQTSMNTLDNLKKSLDLSGASKGLENVGDAARKLDFSGIRDGVGTVMSKCSSLEVMAVTALANITNSAVNAGKRIASAFTIDPVKTGFEEYETQINAVQTILANTESKGSTLKDVNSALDELNHYADMTIYNFTEMTRNIGTFTAAGVDLKTSVSAIKGIANLAAVSGSNSQQASTAMYQLSQALAAGTVKLMDWNSVVNAGMGGEVFQNALKETSRLLGTGADAAIKANGSFRESLQTGWLTSEVLTETLKKFTTSGANEYVAEYTGLSQEAIEAALKDAKARYGEADAIEYASQALAEKSGKNKDEIKSALEMAKTAEDAATKVKTFSQLIDTVKEAVQSGWTQTWEILIGDFEEAKELFTNISDFVGNIIQKSADARNAVLEGAMGSKWDTFIEKVNEAGVSTEDFQNKLKETAKEHGIAVDDLIKEHGTLASVISKGLIPANIFTETLKKFIGAEEDVSKSTDGMTDKLEYFQKVVDQVWNGDFKNGEERVKALSDAGYDYAKVQDLVNKTVDGHRLTLEDLSDTQLENVGYTKEEISALRQLAKEAEETGTDMNKLIENMSKPTGRELLIDSFKNALSGLMDSIKAIKEAWTDIFPEKSIEDKQAHLYSMIESLHSFSERLKMTDKTADNLKRTFKGLFAILDIVKTFVGGGFTLAWKVLSKVLGAFDLNILDVTASVGDAIVAFHDLVFENNVFIKSLEKLVSGIKTGVKFIKQWVDMFMKIPEVQSAISNLEQAFSDKLSSINDYFSGGMDRITDFIQRVKDMDSISLTDLDGIFKDFKDNVLDYFLDIDLSFDGIKDAVKSFKDTIVNQFDKSGEKIEWFKDKFLELGDFLKKKLPAILSIGAGVFLIAAISKISKALEVLAGPLEGLENLFNSLAAVPQSISKWFKAKEFETQTEAVKNLAVSIAILAGSLALLSQINQKNLWSSVGALSVLTLVLTGLALAIGKMQNLGDFGKASLSLLALSGSLILIAACLKIVSGISVENLVKGLAAIAVLETLVAGLITVSSLVNENSGKIGGSILKVSAALLLLVGIMKITSSMSANDIIKGVLVIAALELLVSGLIAVSKLAGKHADKIGGSIFKISAALIILVGVMKLTANMSAKDLLKGIATIAALELLVSGLIAVSKLSGKHATKAGAMILQIGLALLALVAVIKIASGLSPEALVKGCKTIAALEVLMTGLIAASNLAGKNAAKAGTMLLMVSGALLVLTGVIYLLQGLSLSGLAKGIAAIASLEILFAELIAVTKLAQDCKSTLIILTVVVTLLSIALIGLSQIDSASLATASASLSAVMYTFALLIASTKLLNTMKLGKTMLALGELLLVVVALGSILTLFAALNPGPTLEIAASISLLLLSLSGACTILSTIGSNANKAIPAALVMSVVVSILAGILGTLSYLNVNPSLEAAASLSLLLLSLSGACAILSLAGANATAAIPAALGMSVVVAVLGTVLGALAYLDIKTSLETAASLSLLLLSLSGACAILALAGIGGPAALIGIASLMALVVGVGSLITGIGALVTYFPQLETFLNNGLPILEQIGTGLGSFFGNIVSSFAESAMSAIPALGQSLADFMTNAQPFFNGIPQISGDALSGVKNLAEIMLILAGANIADKIASIISGESSMEKFSTDLQSFAKAITQFSSYVEGKVNEGAITAAANAGMLMTELANSVPKVGGVAQALAGTKDLGAFGSQLQAYGKGLVVFSETVSEEGAINETAITAAKNAGLIMVELANTIPNMGGVVGFFTGNKGIGNFGSQLKKYGEALASFSKTVSEEGAINEASIEAAKKAGLIMIELVNSIPDMGGVIDFFTGNKGIANFGSQLKKYGEALVEFSGVVSEEGAVNLNGIRNAKQAGSMMVELVNNIPEEDNIENVKTFGSCIKKFGGYLEAFSESIAEVNAENVSAAIIQARRLLNLMSDMIGFDPSGVTNFSTGLASLGSISIDSFVSSFENAGERVSTAVSSMMNAMTNAVNSQKGKLTTAFVTAVDVSVTSISAKQGQFRSSGVIIMTGLITGVSSQKGRLISVTTSLILATISAIMQKQPMFSQAGIVVMTGFAGGISSCQQASIDSVNLVLDSCIQAINDNYQDFYDAGEYLGDGLIAGIEAKEQAAYDAGYALGQAAVRGEKDGQQSHSPSKATIKAGKWLGEGLVIGMQQMSRSVYNAGGSMGEQAVDSISNALEYVSSLSETDLDIQPTIRPVVDMSGLSANGISLSSSIDLSLTKPIDSLSEIVSKAQAEITASNLEVVNAINGLREDLNNMADDQEVSLYVDSKKLASTLAKPMNRELHVLYKRGAY